jgi:hypothetical protein
MKCLIHKGAKAGDLLRFNDTRTMLVLQSGQKINVVRNLDGTVRRETKDDKRAQRQELKTSRWLSRQVVAA